MADTKEVESQYTGDQKKIPDVEVLNETYGASGTKMFSGIIQEEYNPSLQGQQAAEIYEQMRRGDATVSAALLACQLPIRSTKRSVEAYKEDGKKSLPKDQEIADFVSDVLFSELQGGWDSFLRQALSMLDFGFSLFEKIYQVKDGKIKVKKLSFRKQSTIFSWETSTQEDGVQQQLFKPPTTGPNKGKTIVDIPGEKLLRFTINQEGENYEGISLLRPAYKHWYIKSNLEKFDATRHEKQGIGVPVIYLPLSASVTDKAEAMNILDNFKTNEQSSVLMPGPKSAGREIEFLDLKAGDSTNMLDSIKYQDRQILKSTLTQFLELGNTESGSRSLGESQTDLFLGAMESFAKLIAETMNQYLIKEMVDLNFNTENYPKLVFEPLVKSDLVATINTIATATSSGIIVTDDTLEGHIRSILQLPEKEEVEEVPAPQDPIPKDPIIDKKIIEDNQNNDMKDPKEFHDHHHKEGDIGCCTKDQEFMSLCKFFDNTMIKAVQNQASKQELEVLKKKGFRFNDYELESFRPLTFAERKVNFTSMKREVTKNETELRKEIERSLKNQKDDLLVQIKELIDNNDIAGLGIIKARLSSADIASKITDVQKDMFEFGKKSASGEMNVPVPATSPDVRGIMRTQSDAAASKIANDMENLAKTNTATQLSRKGGDIEATKSGKVVTSVSDALDSYIARTASGMATIGVNMALNLGRSTIFERYPEKVYAMQYSAIIDDRTTDRCLSLDGRVVKPGSAAFYDYSPPQHRGCRSVRVEILEEEEYKPDITGIPDSIKPTMSIDNTPTMTKPVLFKGSPAVSLVKQEIEQRKGELELLKSQDKYPNRQEAHEQRIQQLESSIAGLFSEMANIILAKELGL